MALVKMAERRGRDDENNMKLIFVIAKVYRKNNGMNREVY